MAMVMLATTTCNSNRRMKVMADRCNEMAILNMYRTHTTAVWNKVNKLCSMPQSIPVFLFVHVTEPVDNVQVKLVFFNEVG